MVADQILPSLAKVSSKDPGVLMAVLGIYKMVFECEKFGINKDQCAKGILPFLISTSVESTLNLQQFEQFIALVHKLLEKVETEQRKALRQMTASQAEQRKITDFADFLNNQASAGTTTNGGFQQQQQQADVVDLGDVSFMLGGASTDQTLAKPAGGTSAQNPVNNGNKIGLTLDEKKRIIAEKEEQMHRPTGQHRTDQSPDMANLQPQTTNALRFDLFATQSGPSPSLHQQPMRPPMSLSQTVSPGLEEFMPELLGTARAPRPSSTTPAGSTQHPMAQSSSFAAFPSIPLPNNNSANPIQRRAVGGQGLTMAGTSDPFDSLLMDIQRQTPMEAKEIANFTADLLGQLNQTQKKMTESKKEKDPFEELMG